jgi:hypothetical protein
MRGSAVTLAFLMELAVYAAVTYWGFTRDARLLVRWCGGLGALALFITAWALFGAPGATYPLHGAGRVMLEVCWYGLAAVAVQIALGWRAAAAFVGGYLISVLLLWVTR